MRGVEQARPQADQTAGRNVEAGVRELSADVHLFQLAAPLAGEFHDAAELVRRHFDDERFKGLVRFAVDLFEDHLRLADRQLIAFAAHVLDQH